MSSKGLYLVVFTVLIFVFCVQETSYLKSFYVSSTIRSAVSESWRYLRGESVTVNGLVDFATSKEGSIPKEATAVYHKENVISSPEQNYNTLSHYEVEQVSWDFNTFAHMEDRASSSVMSNSLGPLHGSIERSMVLQYDGYPDRRLVTDHVRLNDESISRHLSTGSSRIGTFYPLICNSNLDNEPCGSNFASSLPIPANGSAWTIPCGKCYTFDLGANTTFPTGLRISGKLVFPTNYKTVIYTPSVLVEGALVIRSNTSIISPENMSVRFVLTGTSDLVINTTTSAPNQLACNTSVCNVGKKAFVVAGGKVDIRGMPETCKSWTNIKDTILKKPAKNPALFKQMVLSPQQCVRPSIVFFQDSFTTFAGNWTGREGGFVDHNAFDGTLTVSNRKYSWQGPNIDVTRLMPSSCLVPNQDYLLSARIRLDKADGTSSGTPTICAVNGTFCPRLTSRIGKLPSGESYSTKHTMPWRYAGKYGEWVDMTATIQWSADELSAVNVAYWILYIEGPEPGATVSLDDFIISLPDSSSYLKSSDICSELLPNGDAQGNGYNPYPFRNRQSDEKVLVMTENGNKFFRLQNRRYYYSSITANIDPRCLDRGVTYVASVKVRILADFAQEYYILLTLQRPSGTWFDRTILDCPGQRLVDGWVTCSGEFTVDKEMSESITALWSLYLKNTRDGYLYTIDYDDISIRFQNGYVEKLVVDGTDASCWGVGSDIHITSSTFYNGGGAPIKGNGYKGKIVQVESTGNGTVTLQMDAAPTEPIVTQASSSEFSAEVGLLSRNVMIEGRSDESNGKGAFFQILHTPDTAQIIDGVQFLNMGRLGEVDHFAVHFLYNGFVNGTMVTRNSIVDSNQRGIVIEGSSNIIIYDNIGYNIAGHGCYVGDESQGNRFEHNLISQTKVIDRSLGLPGENDYDAAAFFSRYPPNSFVSNVASGNGENGFYFTNSIGSRDESGGQGTQSPRKLQVGPFLGNIAHSNAYSGFAMYDYEPSDTVTFVDSKSYKNILHGFFLYNGHKVIINGGIYADNRYGIEARWSDNVTITDVDVRGFSTVTRVMTKPPHFAKMCPSTDPVVGFRMQTVINYSSETRGVVLKNSAFSNFDSSPDCRTSVAIDFNTVDKRENHFDYVSTFSNISVKDSRSNIQINACPAEQAGINDIVITNLNGVNFGNISGVSSVVSNVPSLKTFSSVPCVVYPEVCIAHCGNTCLRTVEFSVEQTGTQDWTLQVIKDGPESQEIYVGNKYLFDGNSSLDNMQNEANLRKFYTSLPLGSYTARFLDGSGEVAWPRFVLERWTSQPDCDNFASAPNVALFRPTLNDCSNLIANGDFESGTTFPWHHRRSLIRLSPGTGRGGSTALTLPKRTWYYDGPGINIDTRCLNPSKGRYYEIKVWIRLGYNGSNIECDPMSSDSASNCPSVTFKVVRHVNATTKETLLTNYYGDKALMVLPYRKDQFNLIYGIFMIDDILASAQQLFFYVEKVNQTFDMTIDDVSISSFDVDSGCDGQIIRNSDFASGSSQYWGWWGTTKREILSGSNFSAGYAFKAYDRARSSSGLSQDLYRNCFVAGDRYAAQVKYQLVTKSGDPFQCNRTVSTGLHTCMEIRFYSSKNGTTTDPTFGVTTVTTNDMSWSFATGIYTVEANAVNADRTAIFFESVDPLLNIIYDEVTFTKIPFSCNTLMLNPTFDGGNTSFYYPDNRSSVKVAIRSSGAGGSGYAALLYDRVDNYKALVQNLDKRCFYENAEYIITAKFSLLNNTALNIGVPCDTNARSGNTQCPRIYINGYNCPSGDVNLNLWNSIPFMQWDANKMNDFKVEFIVTAFLAACKNVRIYIGREVYSRYAVLIDDVQITAKNTARPTMSPTSIPTSPKVSFSPTVSPILRTASPTTSAISCPQTDGESVNLNATHVMVRFAPMGLLCTLVKVTRDETSGLTSLIPLARSYNNYTWESAAGEYAIAMFNEEPFECYPYGCQFTLPEPKTSTFFQLRAYVHSVSEIDQYARFLERTTFGPTQSDLTAIQNISATVDMEVKMALWIQSQTMKNMTSHRMFWRQRANPRLQGSTSVGVPNHPCRVGARYRRFAFVRNDNLWWMTNILRVSSPTSPIVISMNGYVRTVVNKFLIQRSGYENYILNVTHDYQLCGNPEEKVGGLLYVKLENGSCQPVLNPAVNFSGFENLPTYSLQLPGDSSSLTPIDMRLTNGDEFILRQSLNDPICSSLANVVELDDAPIFGVHPDGSWLQFDPRLRLEENTPNNPLPDGGGKSSLDSGRVMACSNVPRTFLNENECFLSNASYACGSSPTPDVSMVLNETTLVTIYNITGRYVYGIKGLAVVDNYNNKIAHPCTPGLRSRWELKDTSQCNVTEIFNVTNMTLSDLLRKSRDTNPYIRDITFPSSGVSCDPLDTDPRIELKVDEKCWTRVHSEYLSVYDFTYWTYNDTHPGNLYAAKKGNRHPIKKWAEDNKGILVFPSTHPYGASFDHPITRWDESFRKFTYIGRFGDTLRFADLPNELRRDQVFSYFGASSEKVGTGVIVCGSVGEVANDKNVGSLFEVATGLHNPPYYIGDNRKFVWNMIALNATDQLRQRVAWSLAQLLVVVKDAIASQYDKTEWFLQYYDIFVRHAFGNYRDILREISYSPLMAENLSFLGSKSAAYVMEVYRYKAFADENFAREIMQLFTIGMIRLNLDGTPKRNADGQKMLAYTNEHVMSFARAWTGFDLQKRRGNMEGYDNRLDPMRIEATWRDRFPKSDLNDGYIGDGYPLCADIPTRMFLRKGAKYRFLGSSSLPELMSDPVELATDLSVKRFILDANSTLRNMLCNKDSFGKCRFLNSVTLASNLPCTGLECLVDTVRVVQVTNSSFYEYVAPACVEQSFFAGAVKVSPRSRYDPVACENPKLAVAGAACCSVGSTTAIRNGTYENERMTYSTARNRCLSLGKDLCDYDYLSYSQSYKVVGYHWTKDPCVIRIRINPAGYVAVVHEPGNYRQKILHVSDDSENFFKVYWRKGFPTASNQCEGICSMIGDTCLCDTTVSTSAVFTSMPTSIKDALDKLRIGSVDPDTYDAGTFYSWTDSRSNITVYTRKAGKLEYDSVFSFIDDIGRKYYFKNALETVQIRSIGGSYYSGYSFRNAPRFMSLLYSETTVRDAQYETEATLDHYFYQDNTAPFISIRLIQRFVSSNPSPRYVKAVASAFRSGSYEFAGVRFGSGKYGDLAASIAAALLDREALSVVLDADPSSGALREPLLKVISLMRSMEYVAIPSEPVVRLYNMETAVGQVAHEFPSVFSFFLPEFKPSGWVGDAGLVSPEATLLDTPKIVGILNGLFSMINYGLSDCAGGFGPYLSGSCYEGLYSKASGTLGFNVTSESPFDNFFETFEGPSLVGGFDSRWVGRYMGDYHVVWVTDLVNSTNHALAFNLSTNSANIFSRILTPDPVKGPYVVKFRYFSPASVRGGGCIGLYDVNFGSQQNFFCDSPGTGSTIMMSSGKWITCQFDVPVTRTSFRIGLMDSAGVSGGVVGDAYFDDIQVVPGSGTSCTGITLQERAPPGKAGYSSAVVNVLATLLTAGRLSALHREKIRTAFDSAGSANDGLRLAMQLIATTAEFHSTNIVKTNGQSRDKFTFPPPSGRPYRAVVYMMFAGGCDSYNMLVPYSCTKGKDLYSEYLQVRQQVALTRPKLLEVPSDNQVCESFGIHGSLKAVKQLYMDGDLLFFANTGVLTVPVTKYNYNSLTKTQLFAHDHMQKEAKRVDPLEERSNSGVLGRMTDVLSRRGHVVGSFSVDRYSVALVGEPGTSSSPIIVSNGDGVTAFNAGRGVRSYIPSLHESTLRDNGFFAETWSNNLIESLDTNDLLKKALQNVQTSTTFPNTYLGRQLRTVARLIDTRDERGVDTDTFYVEIGGFDTHADVEINLVDRFSEVDNAIAAFAAELKAMGVWNNVTTIQTSDFARTLAPNSGDGTDHAWAGNYMMFGGDVKGRQIVGKYPDDLTDYGPLGLGRGRLIPTTSWDAVFQGIANWLSIRGDDLDIICPNRDKFSALDLFTADDLFISGVRPSPTAPPTLKPSSKPTGKPTSKPTWTRTEKPTNPTSYPTRKPTSVPSKRPTVIPTRKPSRKPSPHPSGKPSRKPTSKPTWRPSNPTLRPTKKPTTYPTRIPSRPLSKKPSKKPTRIPTSQPTWKRSALPSRKPTKNPTIAPSRKTTRTPTKKPTRAPSWRPTKKPTRKPTTKPTRKPTKKPTRRPTKKPTRKPTKRPTRKPSRRPSRKPV